VTELLITTERIKRTPCEAEEYVFQEIVELDIVADDASDSSAACLSAVKSSEISETSVTIFPLFQWHMKLISGS